MGAILNSAALAPSVGNSQPWRFVRLRSPAVRAALARHVEVQNAQAAQLHAAERHARYRALKLHGLDEAPEIIAVFCDEKAEAGHGLGIATMPETLRYSVVLAIHTLWLAAKLRGIGVGWVSILDPQVIAAMLDVPARWSLIAVLCVGYPAEETDIPELERSGWQPREPLADRLFER
jgi:5,6-dimethylbenzimidazole synthase